MTERVPIHVPSDVEPQNRDLNTGWRGQSERQNERSVQTLTGFKCRQSSGSYFLTTTDKDKDRQRSRKRPGKRVERENFQEQTGNCWSRMVKLDGCKNRQERHSKCDDDSIWKQDPPTREEFDKRIQWRSWRRWAMQIPMHAERKVRQMVCNLVNLVNGESETTDESGMDFGGQGWSMTANYWTTMHPMDGRRFSRQEEGTTPKTRRVNSWSMNVTRETGELSFDVREEDSVLSHWVVSKSLLVRMLPIVTNVCRDGIQNYSGLTRFAETSRERLEWNLGTMSQLHKSDLFVGHSNKSILW